MAKTKKIWSQDTAEKIAKEKTAKYGELYEAAPMTGGGFEIVTTTKNVEAFIAMVDA